MYHMVAFPMIAAFVIYSLYMVVTALSLASVMFLLSAWA